MEIRVREQLTDEQQDESATLDIIMSLPPATMRTELDPVLVHDLAKLTDERSKACEAYLSAAMPHLRLYGTRS